ncbi:MAG: hypothetical protein JWQ81_6671 [Amycolatopsis sp.]|jgi:hypothetical protein|nr:hypothetical protein [Amycolatopsis sp.]
MMRVMAMGALNPERYVRTTEDHQVRLAWCFDPDTGDVVVDWTSRAALDPNAGGLPAPADRRLFKRGEYRPEPPDDADFPWSTDGPCRHLL